MRSTLSLALACVACFVFAAAARAGTTLSSNWAGYAVTITRTDPAGGETVAGTFTAVAATWVQPAATCPLLPPSASAIWVGLGGFTEEAQGLEQIGTVTTCNAKGVAGHSVLYEVLPAPAVEVKLKVRTGDRIRAAVSISGRQVAFTLKNLTRGTRFSKRVTITAAPDLSSAEWILETPSFCAPGVGCVQLALPHFGTVSVFSASAIGDGHAGTISDPAWSATAVELVSDDSLDPDGATRIGAVPTVLSADGGSFDVRWRSDLEPPVPGPTPSEERLSFG